MKTSIKVTGIIFLVLTAGCAKVKDDKDGVSVGNGAYLQMQADLTDAQSITSNVVTKVGGTETKSLLKISPDGKISALLKGEHDLLSYKITAHYIVARVKIMEEGQRCSLIAIPKVKGSTKVRCLNRTNIHCQRLVTSNDGFDVRGDEVYFAVNQSAKPKATANSEYCDNESNGGTASELRHWDGKSESVQTVFHSDPTPVRDAQPLVRDVFTSVTNENLCIETTNGGIFCFDGKDKKWFKPDATKFEWRYYSKALKQGNMVLASGTGGDGVSYSKINLEDFSLSPRQGALPEHIHFRRDNGRIVGAYNKDIYCVEPNGDSQIVLKNISNETQPARLDKWGWYFGGSTLKRIELDSCKLDAKEYLPETKLFSVSLLSWSLGDFLRVDGIGAAGMPATSLLNGDGRLFSNETKSIPIEHPIDLAW